ncbi:MAG: rod shape-determining protein [Candidatus Thiodiazotropha sp. (ex. Lucinisca nassula)]|nr:rod shape-determining protein [Candidatus Thiodiazotropha sp. (ex. Lucinisca nassula)]MBW9275626.1 rod shape-determining protein [Candidatus Thiodiazotropha sp. (ex. Lucinisca nassula)]
MSIIQLLLGKLSKDVVIEIAESQIRVFSFNGEAEYYDEPLIAIKTDGKKETILEIGKNAATHVASDVTVLNPFSHPRSMVASFTFAEKIIQHAIRELHQSIFRPAPRVIMHQLEKNEGGLTEIEDRVLRELALGAGAREVIVYSGAKINKQIDSYDAIKSKFT